MCSRFSSVTWGFFLHIWWWPLHFIFMLEPFRSTWMFIMSCFTVLVHCLCHDAALHLINMYRPSCTKLSYPESSGWWFDILQGFRCSMRSKAGFQINGYRTRTFKIKAKAESGDGYTRLAPLRFESPSGQLLVQILQSHPHLLPATVDQQLENLQSEKDSQKEEASKLPQDLLYKYAPPWICLNCQVLNYHICCSVCHVLC